MNDKIIQCLVHVSPHGGGGGGGFIIRDLTKTLSQRIIMANYRYSEQDSNFFLIMVGDS